MEHSAAALLQEALQLHRQNRLAEAEPLYRAALAKAPDSFEALYLCGLLHMQQGRVQEAAPLVSAAVDRQPESPEALALMAGVLSMLNRGAEALRCFDRVLAMQPGNLEARYNRAVALGGLRRFAEALADYDQVLAAMPDHVQSWFNRGNTLGQLDRYDEAVASYDRALALAPNFVEALINRGNALLEQKRYTDALASFDRALGFQPGQLDALTGRALALHGLGRAPEALAACEAVLARKPDHISAHVAKGNMLRAADRHAEALASYETALRLAPSDVELINNRIIALADLGRADEALAAADHAAALDPDNPQSHLLRGNALQTLDRHQDAIAEYEKVLAIQADHWDARVNSSLSLLQLGRFEDGWTRYEARWRQDNPALVARSYRAPRWNGERLAGTLLVWGEQGLGDVILHAGMLEELRKRVGRLVIEVEPRLVPLFARSFPDAEVVAMGPGLYGGPIDAHVPFASLGRYLRPDWTSFPRRERGYLVADEARAQALRGRLATSGERLIGVSWHSASARLGAFKSARLADFEALLRLPSCRFVDLQYGDTAAERQAVEAELGVRVERVEDIDNRNDIDGLAALIAACDAVVTVSNTTAHLAGALGRPTWVMVPHGFGRLWYWFKDRDESPWYPQVHLRRQDKGQPWKDVVASVAAGLT